MSKIDEVRKAMVEAMKAGNKERKESLSMLLSALKNKAIDKREDLTEAEENEVVLKEIKQTKETLEMTPADREDLVNECKNRISVYEEFAPKMLGEEEIKEVIQGVLAELGIEMCIRDRDMIPSPQTAFILPLPDRSSWQMLFVKPSPSRIL